MDAGLISAAMDVAIQRVEELRTAGITRFRFGDLEFDIGPAVPPPLVLDAKDKRPVEEKRGVMESARTFGMARGVPRFKRDANADDDPLPEGIE